MKRSFFYFAVCLIARVVLAEEQKQEQGPNIFQQFLLWIDDRNTGAFNPTAVAKPGDECTVAGINGLIPDPFHWGPTYYGDAQLEGACYDGIPVHGNSFSTDSNARGTGAEYLKDELACCIRVACGDDLTGYCNTKGIGCKDIGVIPLATSKCPGSNSQCCPSVAQKSDASPGGIIDLTAFGGPAGSDMFTDEPISLGTSGQDIAFGTDTLPVGSLNTDDWTTPPPGNENLFLANDDSSDYGTVASLGGGSIGDFDSTA